MIISFSQVILRIVRRYYKFPIPAFLIKLIDNPIRRRLIQPPEIVADRINLRSGMTVIEIGPGKGSYTVAVAKRVLPSGKVYAIDIQEQVINQLKDRIEREGIPNVCPKIDNVHDLSFEDNSVDRVLTIAALPEIPEPVKAMKEFHRVLKPDGLVCLSELLPDADYPLRRTEKRWAEEAGFELENEYGNFFLYYLNFRKKAS